MELQKKRVLVTGASSRIGRATAIAFAKKGAEVIVHYRGNKEGAEETFATVQGHSDGKIIQADLAEKSEVEQMFNTVGTVDVLVNNAGNARGGALHDQDAWEPPLVVILRQMKLHILSWLSVRTMLSMGKLSLLMEA